jgi:hypothetical protein
MKIFSHHQFNLRADPKTQNYLSNIKIWTINRASDHEVSLKTHTDVVTKLVLDKLNYKTGYLYSSVNNPIIITNLYMIRNWQFIWKLGVYK